MVKPEKATRVEEMLMHAAKSGALGGKVTEDQFIQMLEQVRKTEKKYWMVISRRTILKHCFHVLSCDAWYDRRKFEKSVIHECGVSGFRICSTVGS